MALPVLFVLQIFVYFLYLDLILIYFVLRHLSLGEELIVYDFKVRYLRPLRWLQLPLSLVLEVHLLIISSKVFQFPKGWWFSLYEEILVNAVILSNFWSSTKLRSLTEILVKRLLIYILSLVKREVFDKTIGSRVSCREQPLNTLLLCVPNILSVTFLLAQQSFSSPVPIRSYIVAVRVERLHSSARL